MLRRILTETAEERADRLTAQDRENFEQVLAAVHKLRLEGYTARVGWVESEGFTGSIPQVACADCGRFTGIETIGLELHWNICQECWYDRKEAAD